MKKGSILFSVVFLGIASIGISACNSDDSPIEREKYYLGYYPQTRVDNESLISTLNTKSGILPTSFNSRSWTSYKYYFNSSNETNFMWYQDVVDHSGKYRGVYFTSYRPYYATSQWHLAPNTYQDDNGYYINTCYWFKFEPLSWDKISSSEEAGLLLMSSKVIDSQEYYHSPNNRTISGETIFPNNYKESDIRKWLNNSFLNTAFSSSEKELIRASNVDNSAYSTGQDNNPYAVANTYDKLFLPSFREVTNADYKFDTGTLYHVSRERIATDYAKAMGVRLSHEDESVWWQLRSPTHDFSTDFQFVTSGGKVLDSDSVDSNDKGILPAFRLR